MKNLELTQMEIVNGGECTNTDMVMNTAGVVSVAFGALLVVSTGGLALFAIGAATALYSTGRCTGAI